MTRRNETPCNGSEKTLRRDDMSRRKPLSPEAVRALNEAEARRRAAPPVASRGEIGGRGGLEPTRYGDWEKNGLATDF
jgi:hypothetical protein